VVQLRKVVVPVAGLGTRFWPATAVLPKEMLPLVDRPAIEYAVDEALRAGLHDLLFITSRAKRAIEDHFDVPPDIERLAAEKGIALSAWSEARFHFVRQNRPLGLGHAVSLAEEHVGTEPFAVMLPDDVLLGPPDCMAEMVRLAGQSGRPVVAVRRVQPEQVSAYGVIRPVGEVERGVYEVGDLVEKPSPERAPSTLAIVGRYVLPADVFRLLRETGPATGGEIQLTDALRALNRECPMLAYHFPGRVFDTGSKLGFLQATVEIALEHPQLGAEFAAYLARRVETLAAAQGA
jgi:UTP--glucose-1-phosphate uridylyltransferase